ncbi:hypothetical protein GCM10011513_11940 [Franconibacter daqui]|nr:hypothetical protein GCM10011513_11940 [Franconibacter daqui]
MPAANKAADRRRDKPWPPAQQAAGVEQTVPVGAGLQLTIMFDKTKKSILQKISFYDVKPLFQSAFPGDDDLC